MVTDGAWVKHLYTGDLIPPCPVGVAVKTQSRAGETDAVAEGVKIHFNIMVVTVGEEYTNSVYFFKAAVGLKGPEVAVSPNFPQGNAGAILLEAAGVASAVAKMNDKAGRDLIHSTEHIFFASVGVAHNQDFRFGTFFRC